MTNEPAACTVAIAGRVPREQVDAMTERLPHVAFVRLPADAAPPADAGRATVLLTAGLSREELRATLRSLPALRWIHSASSGLDRLLVPEIGERRLRLTRTAGARAVAMAEYVVAMTLALRRRLPDLLEAMRAARWQRLTAGTLAGSTIGIVGAGVVGRAAARRLRPFGTRIVALKRTPVALPEFDEVWGPDRLSDLLRVADVVVLACPLTAETHRLLGRTQFASMKPSALLVNVARGEVVVEEDLIAALERGEIGGAALDVFEREPLPPESPLWRLPNVIVTPHASSATPGVWEAITGEFLTNLERFLAGLPLANEVHPPELGS